MGSLFLVFRAFVMTVIVIFILQVKIGDQTLEQKSEAWIKASPFIGHLQEVADGALVVAQKVFGQFVNIMDTKVKKNFDSSNLPGRRFQGTLERSQEFVQEQGKKAQAKIERALREEADRHASDLQEKYFDQFAPYEDEE